MLISTLVVSLATLAFLLERQRYRERASLATQNITRLLEQNIADAFDKVDVVLRSVAYRYRDELMAGHVDQAKLTIELARQQALIPDVLSLRISDKIGIVRFGNELPTNAPIVVSDRDFFIRAREKASDDLIVSGPIFGRFAKQWIVVLARRLNTQDGSFAGIAYVNFATAHFERVLSSVELGPHGAATLRMADLALVHRFPDTKNAVGSKEVSTQLRDTMNARPEEGEYIAVTKIDGVERSNAYRKLKRYPLYVIVGVATDEYLTEWQSNVLMLSGLTALALLLTSISAALVYRTNRRLASDIIERERTEQLLSASAIELKELQRLAGIGEWEWDVRTDQHQWSDEIFAIYGRALAHGPARYPDVMQYFTQESWKALSAAVERCRADGKTYSCDAEVVRTDGTHRWITAFGEAVRDDSGIIVQLHGMVQDITERKVAEAALLASEKQFRSLLDGAPEPIFVQAHGCFAYVNKATLTLFGAANKDQLLGRPVLERIHPDYHALVTQRVRQINDEEQDTPPIEETYLRFDGTPVAVAVSAVPVHYGGEHGALVFVRDITEQKEHEDRLKAIAYHDPLTKLPNRLLLGDRLQQAISQNQRTGTLIAVCYLDLDGFKEINDNFGHQTGDRVLVEVADRLQAAVRGGDTVARLGGDEFVLLLCGLLNEEECQVAVRRMVQAIAAPYQIGGHPQATISASIGITIFPNDHADPDTLVRHADHAMYSAKQAGKNRFHLFDTPLEQRIEARHAMLTRIEEALASQHFVLHYQPKFDCKNARIVGVEALIRWQHPTLGLLMPAAFLPMIEDDPLAISVGEWVIREALRQVVQWTQNGVDLQVSVNAFASQLIEGDFALQLEAILREYPGINPNHLQIEIVETAALEELDVVRRVIEDCAALGVGFALDDFGTGYSSLAYLRHLPAREIKIDQTFVRDMLEDADDQAIVEAVIGLGRAFRRTVVAEGAETSAHIARLLSLGCDIVQGYAIARPMSGTDIAKWIRDFKPDPNWGRPAPVIDEPF